MKAADKRTVHGGGNGGTFVGYARVSTTDQNLELQQDALAAAGCTKVFEDTVSGAKADRPGLAEALGYLRAGDTLVVWRLDRLGRSLKDLITLVARLEAGGIGFKSITEAIDTTTNSGKLIFHIFSALAEFERALIQERTQAGLTAARARGRKGGRPQKLSVGQAQLLYQLYDDKKHTLAEICSVLGVGRTTVYKYLGRRAADK